MEWKDKIGPVIEKLRSSPGDIYNALQEVQAIRAEISLLQDDLKVSEVNAELFAYDQIAKLEEPKKMLADEKKLRIQQMAQADKMCVDLRGQIRAAEVRLAEANMRYETAKNMFGAVRAMADLLSAMLNHSVPGI